MPNYNQLLFQLRHRGLKALTGKGSGIFLISGGSKKPFQNERVNRSVLIRFSVFDTLPVSGKEL
jgi:hypothetical protein